MIAYCGLNCEECPALLATRSGDYSLREKVAEEWSRMYNADISADDINCAGCLSEEGPHFSHCFECNMRICAREKSLDSCAMCDSYPCADLTEFFEYVPEAKARLDGLREKT